MSTDLSGFKLPDIKAADLGSVDTGANYQNIIDAIKKAGQVPGLTQTALPSIAEILSPGGQATSPYAAAINQRTEENVAKTQTDMMKRGLTGSDIESGAMGQARASGQSALAEMYGQTANQLAQMIYQAASGDISSNRELLLTLAQAMGQELTSQRDMEMFQQALRASIDQANSYASAQKSAGWMNLGGSIIGAGGRLGAAAIAKGG